MVKSFVKVWTLILILGGAALFTTCKKGPGDPFISLKSRDARIKGTWELSKVEYSSRTVTVDPDLPCSQYITSNTVVSDDGINFTFHDTTTRYDPINGKCVIEGDQTPFTGSFSFTVNKDGTYNYTASAGTSREEGSGYWRWGDAKKNKVNVIFDRSYSACALANMLEPDNADNIIGGQWFIERLSSKELILVVKCSNTYVDGNRTVTTTRYIKLVFSKAKKK